MPRPQIHIGEFKQLVSTFLASRKDFSVVRNVSSSRTSGSTAVTPRTLLILDSSFNPPSIAHSSMVEAALTQSVSRYRQPCRVLLLLSIQNADKAPSPASFDHRLAMMTLMAETLTAKWAEQLSQTFTPVVDIGLTTQAFYNDKSAAISRAGVYAADCEHVHMVGYDTIIRVFNEKYYKTFSPPFSALNDFFERHKFLVTLRPEEKWGDEQRQKKLWNDILNGKLEHQGAQHAWAESILMRSPESQEIGVSSTSIRKAVEVDDDSTLEQLCFATIVSWIKDHALYK